MAGEDRRSVLARDDRSRACIESLGEAVLLVVEDAAHLAHEIHAEEITVEHVLVALLRDETTAATRTVIAGFADPATISDELLALCPGILVVGSGRTLPFSVGGVRALEAARSRAHVRAAAAVTPEDVLAEALDEVPPATRRALAEAGLSPAPPRREDAEPPVPAGGPLFKRFSNGARRSLGAACRAAAARDQRAIAPAHLALGALECEEGLADAWGLASPAARQALARAGEDPAPLPRRLVPPDAPLLDLLRDLPAGAETPELLGRLLAEASDEVRLLLAQHRVTPDLLKRLGDRFRDA